MKDGKLSKLLTNFDRANQLKEDKEIENKEVLDTLIKDKIGRYYLIHDILFRWDQALDGKHESSPAKQYKKHVKNTLDSFESSVRKEASRRNLKHPSLFNDPKRLDGDVILENIEENTF